jgi:hypothetical protein
VKRENSKANGRIRTDNPWFTKPEQQNVNSYSAQGLAREGESDLAENLAQIPEQYPELNKLIGIWPDLSVELRNALLRAAGL